MISLPLPLRLKMDDWLNRRLPCANQITLDQGRIFIVPTRLSLAMLALVALLFMLGNLFQNTMAYTVSFWLLSLQIISIFYTFRNLSGVQIKTAGSTPCFAGERIHFNYRISHSSGRAAHNLAIGWQEQDTTSVDLQAGGEQQVQLSYHAPRRGLMRPEKLEIQTRYPTGLAVAWSYLRFDLDTIVYPAPLNSITSQEDRAIDCAEEEGHAKAEGVTNFAGVRDYQRGDSPRRVHWAKFAQTGELYTKTFEDNQNQERWLQWSAQHGDTERRLSALCTLVLEAHQNNERYGLDLPGQTIKPNTGLPHRDTCLRALALFQQEIPHA